MYEKESIMPLSEVHLTIKPKIYNQLSIINHQLTKFNKLTLLLKSKS